MPRNLKVKFKGNIEDVEPEDVLDYYKEVHDEYGDFCGDCEHFDYDIEHCKLEHRITIYTMEIGMYTEVHIRRDCSDFKLRKRDDDEKDDSIRNKTILALDCWYQQYCS